MKNFSRFSLSAIAAALILAGCGGGGSSDNSANNNNSGGGQANTSGNLSVTIDPATYPSGSPEALMYAQLNDTRQKGNFGTLKQSSAIDAATKNHANYLFTNYFQGNVLDGSALMAVDPATGSEYGHVEISGKPGFTGVLPTDRVVAAGLGNASAREVLVFGDGISSTGCLDQLLTTVFHRSSLLDPRLRNFGASVTTGPNSSFVCLVDMAWTWDNIAIAPKDWVGIYPGDGQTGLTNGFTGESPDPLPGVVFKGNPVSIHINPNYTLKVTTFTLTDSSGNLVAGKILTSNEFSQYLLTSEAYFVPTSTLKSGTKYTAYFSGTNNGANFSRTWSFTTK